ncbi:MAG: hypothetical protein N4A63_14995 [Vallitalea sp.]|jgi:hypothetical protein|nr:hypothetical protein [Vallitalea sp.]
MKVNEVLYQGMKGIELVTSKLRIVIITEIGPRIAFFGTIDGENLLYWDPEGMEYDDWKLYGGHRVWITRPGADESQDTYLADNDECEYTIKDNGVDVCSPINPIMKTKRGIKIDFVSENELQVTNYITNCGCMLYSGGVWSPTCTKPRDGVVYGIPLGDDSLSWDIVKIVIPRKFAGNTVRIDDPQITYNSKYMIINPMGVITKRAVYAPEGKIIMSWPEENISFIKSSKCIRNGNYPLGGCNIAVFVGQDNFMVEMETFSEEKTILPSETIENNEIWKIINEAIHFDDKN